MQYNAEELRLNLKYLMQKHKFSMSAWATKAGMTEGTLRNFIAGRSNSMQLGNAVALANAANITLDEFLGHPSTVSTLDHALVNKAISISVDALTKSGQPVIAERITSMVEKLIKKYPNYDALSDRGPDYIDGFFDA